MKKSSICIPIFSVFLATLTNYTIAEDSLSNNTLADIEQIVVTGTYAPVAKSLLASTITVIDRQQIEQLQKSSLLDVLRTVPGLFIAQEGGAGGISNVSLRGAESNFTVVLVDGVQVNNPTDTRGGAFDFNSLALASIERIEIVRGAQSAIYGSDALAGVINVITRSGTETTEQTLVAELGERDFHRLAYSASGSTARSGYALTVQQKDSGEQIKGSSFKSREVSGRWNTRLSNSASLDLALRYGDSEGGAYPEQSGGPNLAQANDLDAREATDVTANIKLFQQINSDWLSILGVSVYSRDDQVLSPGIAPYGSVPPNFADNEYRFTRTSWLNSVTISPSLSVNAGVDYKSEHGDSTGYVNFFGMEFPADFSLDRDMLGVFVDTHYQHESGVNLDVGFRHDDSDNFASEDTWRVGLNAPLSRQWRLYANWGEAYKLPSFFALASPLAGNPDLKPETAASWDVGAQWLLSSTVSVDLSVFHYEYEDLVDFDPATFSTVNRSSIETAGFELLARWQILDILDISANTTYVDIDSSEPVTLTGRPQWKSGLNVSWAISQDLNAGLNTQWVDTTLGTSLYTGSTEVTELDDYLRVDANVRWQINPAIKLTLALDNLFDEDYQEAVGFPSPGRALRFSTVLQF